MNKYVLFLTSLILVSYPSVCMSVWLIRQRYYFFRNSSSAPTCVITEVKPGRAGLSLGWVTPREYAVCLGGSKNPRGGKKSMVRTRLRLSVDRRISTRWERTYGCQALLRISGWKSNIVKRHTRKPRAPTVWCSSLILSRTKNTVKALCNEPSGGFSNK